MKELPIHLRKPLSASSLKTFQQCPRKWYYKTIGTPEDYIGSQLLLGKAVHEAVEYFFKEEAHAERSIMHFIHTYNTAYNDYTEAGKEVRYTWSSRRKDIREGEEMLRGFFQQYGDLPVVEVESSLLVEIPIEGANVLCYAGIDLIIEDKANGGYIIADVKTGRTSPHDFYLKQDMQMNQYVYAFKNGYFVEVSADRSTFKPIHNSLNGSPREVSMKKIFNIRACVSKKAEDKPEYYEEEYDEVNYLRTLKAVVKEMDMYERMGYFPKRVGSIHDSPCKFCPYASVCSKES